MAMYDDFAKTFSKSREKMKWPELDLILEIIQKENLKKILDIGCGNGRFLQNFLEKFEEMPEYYLGVDASSNMILEAKKIFENANFIVSNMQDIDKINQNEQFDAIVFLASFHHLDNENDRIEVLEKTKKLLAKNGKIFMTNWNLLGQEKYKNCHTGNGDFNIKIGEFDRYYHGFTLQELEKIFIKTGYKIEKNEIFENKKNIFSIISI